MLNTCFSVIAFRQEYEKAKCLREVKQLKLEVILKWHYAAMGQRGVTHANLSFLLLVFSNNIRLQCHTKYILKWKKSFEAWAPWRHIWWGCGFLWWRVMMKEGEVKKITIPMMAFMNDPLTVCNIWNSTY